MRTTLKSLLVAGLSFVAFQSSSQQSGFGDITYRFKSDSTTTSVLISNLLADNVGAESPIIGTAAWTDKQNMFECRSLLSFFYGGLPAVYGPEQIVEARLILKPLIIPAQNVSIHTPRFVVRRIASEWNDSSVSWNTQPETELKGEVMKSVNEKRKEKTIAVDVTSIMKSMFVNGNNGFMISYRDSLSDPGMFQWFASAKNEEESLRPELEIRFSTGLMSPQLYDDRRPLPNFQQKMTAPIQMNNSYPTQTTPQPSTPAVTPLDTQPKPKAIGNQ
jgi:hypothetical protein